MDHAVDLPRVASPAQDERIDELDELLKNRQLRTGEVCRCQGWVKVCTRKRFDHVENAVPEGARVGHFIEVDDLVTTLRSD